MPPPRYNTVLHVWVSIAILFVSSACGQVVTLLPPLQAPCNQSVPQILSSGTTLSFMVGILHDLGRYDVCQNLPPSRFCTTNFRVMCVKNDLTTEVLKYANGCQVGPVLGLCVSPRDVCSTSELNAQIMDATRETGWFQYFFGPTGACSIHGMKPECNLTLSFGYMDATCMDELPSFTDSSGAIAVFAVVVVICSLSIVCSMIKVVTSWYSDRAAEEIEDASERGLLSLNNKNDSSTCKSKLNEFISWFDLRENVLDFFTIKSRNVGDVDTRFLEGMRTFAMLFVVFGHVLYFPYAVGMYNQEEVSHYVQHFASIGIFPAELAVDTFFYLSGFLFFHLFIKYAEKESRRQGWTMVRPNVRQIPMMYIRRYLRMTPLVMLTMVCAVWLFPFLPTGTMHNAFSELPMINMCHTDWWHQLLYITNMHDDDGWSACMGWFWYLSTDFQLFIAAPLLTILYFTSGFLIWAGVMGAGLVTVAVLQACGAYASFLGDGGTFYDKPYLRCNPYIFGLLLAALVRRPEPREFFSCSKKRHAVYWLGAALMSTSICVMWQGFRCFEQKQKGEPMICPEYFLNFMNSYVVIAWGMGMTCFALPWAVGYGGSIKEFLSLPVFAIMSKLTFCCYMIHPVVILLITSNGYGYPQFSSMLQYANFGAAGTITFFSAFLLHIVVEVPFAKMNDALTR